MNFVSVWLFNRFNYVKVLRLGSLLQICGAWIRCFAMVNGKFWPILLGTVIQSLSASMYWQSQNLVANRWFPSSEYGLITSLWMATTMTMAVGFVLVGNIFSKPDVDTKWALNDLIFHSNFVLTGLFLFFNLTIKSSPEIPPSKVAGIKQPRGKLTEAFGELRQNKNAVLIGICYCAIIAAYNAFGSIVSLMFTPFGMSVGQLSWLLTGTIFIGTIVAVIWGVILDRTRAYKVSLTLGSILALLSMLVLIKALSMGIALTHFDVIFVISAVYLATCIAMIPLCMAFSAEVAFPIQASLVNGCLQFFAQICSCSVAIAGNFWLAADYSQGALSEEQIAR